MATGSRDASVREAKLFVRDVVRNDWEFDPDVPSASSADGTLCHNREVVEWRVREFDSPTSELEAQNSDTEDDDDDPSAAVGDVAIERRRKRRRQMDEEMAWNAGLRVWMARRNAWSGAKTRRQIRAEEEKRALAGQADTTDQSDTGSSATSPATTLPGRSTEAVGASDLAMKTETSLSIQDQEKSEELQGPAETSGQQADLEEGQFTALDEEAKPSASMGTNITDPDHVSTDPSLLATLPAVEDQTEEEKEEEELDEPLLPVAPPFISDDNPVRATINPAIYPSIYTKVVVQGMTPTVPVNLAHLTKAMVQGWKSDGQWPPKPAATSIVLADDATVPKKADASANDAPQGRRKNSITNAVKKVFHFGPFHRRGSSSHDAGNGAGAAGSAV
ncbi:hypothetical protein PENARI_c013G09666 [Penicillium arizonense]|uniref:Gag1-like clamp domain-containing protein n=1 Tax=Penicillium arizonense TaxID=1835702 RepID=A0A1F5LDW3_PENAI|nr:hypothetical protein PENARI_c013G09666 [Penicillium arizonense]OGE51414.1 hypothetical protein PENARI_c013G09666 [Penicillium arizonense]